MTTSLGIVATLAAGIAFSPTSAKETYVCRNIDAIHRMASNPLSAEATTYMERTDVSPERLQKFSDNVAHRQENGISPRCL